MDDLKHPSKFQVNQETVKNFTPKMRLRLSKLINGSSKEESHLQEKDQIPELKSNQGNIKNHSPVSRKATHSATDESVHDVDQSITCYVCGKIFLSDKSLHGHMRSHPGRDWRGSKPPPNWKPQNNSSLTDFVSVSSMSVIDYQEQSSPSTSGGSDFDKGLKGWLKTDKRGRISDTMEAAYALLMLRNGDSLDLAKKNKDRIRVTVGTDLPMKRRKRGNLEFQGKKPKFDEGNENSGAGLIPEFHLMDSVMEIPNRLEEFLQKNTELSQVEYLYRMPSNCMPIRSKMILMEKFGELGEMNYSATATGSSRFDSDVCNKSLSSHQALGGHKSGHKNYKDSIIHNAGREVSMVDVGNQTPVCQLQELNRSISKKNAGIHQCKICNKTFATGQALGGHQTLHRLAPTASTTSTASTLEQIYKESPSSSVSTPEKFIKESSVSSLSPLEKIIKEFSISSAALLDEVGTNGDCNIRMELDLNKPPPLDECF